MTNAIYALCKDGPFQRDFGLANQIRRGAISVMSNIAEGFERGSTTEFAQFLFIVKGSCGEVRAQLQIAADQQYISSADHARLSELSRSISGMISNSIAHLQASQYPGEKFARRAAYPTRPPPNSQTRTPKKIAPQTHNPTTFLNPSHSSHPSHLHTFTPSPPMNPNALINSIGNASLFSSRIFLPAFLTALLLRFGPQIPVLHHLGLLAHLQQNHPAWFTSDYCIVALGILSILEMLAQKNPEARNLLHEFDIYLKPALAILTSFGVIQASDANFAAHTAQQAGFADILTPFISGFLTWRLSVARKEVALAVFDHIEGTHLDHLLSWLEDAWVAFGSLLLILLPLLMLLLIAIATAVLYLLRKRLEITEEKTKFPCPKCQTLIYPSAPRLPPLPRTQPQSPRHRLPRPIQRLHHPRPRPSPV